MRKLLLVFGLFLVYISHAQYTVTLHIRSVPAYSPNDAIYLAGAFNNWNPESKEYMLQKDISGGQSLSIPAPKGRYEFKITRGSWSKVEVDEKGKDLPNRTVEISSDTNIYITVANWKDHFMVEERKSTANKRVKIISDDFYMPQLGRHRRIWIYLPKNYGHSQKRYPVVYMHDGQNLFDDITSFSGEWGVDEAMDTLGNIHRESIVVGIDNGGDKRLNEYCPYDMEKYGKGEGDKYVDFLVKTLRPYIDQHYRTTKKNSDNYIAGSSMGGLISMYAILKYPDKFGGAGVFSPAFWIAPAIKDDVAKHGSKVKGKIYFYAGKQESEHMVPDMLAVFEAMHKVSKAKMEIVIRDEGKHDESTWRREFPLFYKWLVH